MKNVYKLIPLFFNRFATVRIGLLPLCAAAVCLAAASASVTVCCERLVQLLLRFCRAKIIFGALRACRRVACARKTSIDLLFVYFTRPCVRAIVCVCVRVP